MDKPRKIVAAAVLAASIAHAAPAFSAAMTAEQFVQGLSTDFASGDYASAQSKLLGIQKQGFEGIRVDNRLMSVDRLMEILAAVEAGQLSPSSVAAQLLRTIADARHILFLNGGMQVVWVDPSAPGHVFPAGSAG